MKHVDIRTLIPGFARMALGLCVAVSALGSDAGLVRTVSNVEPGRVVVELAWAFSPTPESAMVVAEQIPEGWFAQLDAGSAALVERVRTEPGAISFLIGLEALASPGKIVYVLTQAAPQGGSAPLSGTYLKSEGVHVVSAAIAGASEFTAPAGDQIPGPGETAAFKIVDFSLSGGDDPRITLTWQGGASGKPVVVEWMPLPSPSTAPLRKDASTSDAEAEAGWQEFWAVPVAEPQVRDAGAPGAAASESATPTYVASPDKAAPPGLYRLRTTD